MHALLKFYCLLKLCVNGICWDNETDIYSTRCCNYTNMFDGGAAHLLIEIPHKKMGQLKIEKNTRQKKREIFWGKSEREIFIARP